MSALRARFSRDDPFSARWQPLAPGDRGSALAFDARGNFLALGQADGVVLVWDVSLARALVRTLRVPPDASAPRALGVVALAWAAHSRVLFAATAGGAVVAFDVVSGRVLRVLLLAPVLGGTTGIRSLKPHPCAPHLLLVVPWAGMPWLIDWGGKRGGIGSGSDAGATLPPQPFAAQLSERVLPPPKHKRVASMLARGASALRCDAAWSPVPGSRDLLLFTTRGDLLRLRLAPVEAALDGSGWGGGADALTVFRMSYVLLAATPLNPPELLVTHVRAPLPLPSPRGSGAGEGGAAAAPACGGGCFALVTTRNGLLMFDGHSLAALLSERYNEPVDNTPLVTARIGGLRSSLVFALPHDRSGHMKGGVYAFKRGTLGDLALKLRPPESGDIVRIEAHPSAGILVALCSRGGSFILQAPLLTAWPGPMFPPGFALTLVNREFLEPEDELDLIDEGRSLRFRKGEGGGDDADGAIDVLGDLEGEGAHGVTMPTAAVAATADPHLSSIQSLREALALLNAKRRQEPIATGDGVVGRGGGEGFPGALEYTEEMVGAWTVTPLSQQEQQRAQKDAVALLAQGRGASPHRKRRAGGEGGSDGDGGSPGVDAVMDTGGADAADAVMADLEGADSGAAAAAPAVAAVAAGAAAVVGGEDLEGDGASPAAAEAGPGGEVAKRGRFGGGGGALKRGKKKKGKPAGGARDGGGGGGGGTAMGGEGVMDEGDGNAPAYDPLTLNALAYGIASAEPLAIQHALLLRQPAGLAPGPGGALLPPGVFVTGSFSPGSVPCLLSAESNEGGAASAAAAAHTRQGEGHRAATASAAAAALMRAPLGLLQEQGGVSGVDWRVVFGLLPFGVVGGEAGAEGEGVAPMPLGPRVVPIEDAPPLPDEALCAGGPPLVRLPTAVEAPALTEQLQPCYLRQVALLASSLSATALVASPLAGGVGVDPSSSSPESSLGDAFRAVASAAGGSGAVGAARPLSESFSARSSAVLEAALKAREESMRARLAPAPLVPLALPAE